jgi:hypothetical protein
MDAKKSRQEKEKTFGKNFPRSVLEVTLTAETRSIKTGECLETKNVVEERELVGIYDMDDV